jgi:DNA-binding NtrC family response regulator
MENSKVILLVEDDAAQRLVIEKALKNEGYTVLSAEDSAEANAHAKQRQWVIDLLLADIKLPGLTGGEFGDFVKSINQDLKIIYMSGAPEDEEVQKHLRQKKATFIAKPFSPKELVLAVKRALGEI